VLERIRRLQDIFTFGSTWFFTLCASVPNTQVFDVYSQKFESLMNLTTDHESRVKLQSIDPNSYPQTNSTTLFMKNLNYYTQRYHVVLTKLQTEEWPHPETKH
jgi:hypothetical protein